MGTRRSKHNKGRKPLYKEHRRGLIGGIRPSFQVEREAEPVVLDLGPEWRSPSGFSMASPNYVYRPWSEERRFRASENMRAHLAGLPRMFPHVDPRVDAQANRKAIEALLYTPEGIWRPKPKVLKTTKRRTGRGVPLLTYPYVRKDRPEAADLLAVNALVPKVLGGDMRADICQEIMLALFEGRTSLEELRSHRENTHFFVKKFWRDNFEQSGHAVSLSGFEDDDRTYDEIASSLAARDWRHQELNEARSAYDALRTFYAPTQLDDVFADQVLHHQTVVHLGGESISFEEASNEIDADDFIRPEGTDWKAVSFERIGHYASIRAALWREQKGRCFYCKALTRLPEEAEPSWLPVATLEHRKPQSSGGRRYDRDNLAMSCQHCNIEKGDAPEAVFLAQRARSTPTSLKTVIKQFENARG